MTRDGSHDELVGLVVVKWEAERDETRSTWVHSDRDEITTRRSHSTVLTVGSSTQKRMSCYCHCRHRDWARGARTGQVGLTRCNGGMFTDDNSYHWGDHHQDPGSWDMAVVTPGLDWDNDYHPVTGTRLAVQTAHTRQVVLIPPATTRQHRSETLPPGSHLTTSYNLTQPLTTSYTLTLPYTTHHNLL